MKNKFIKILFIFILNLNFFELTYGKEFIFNFPEIEVKDSGNIYESTKRGKIISNDQIEIISNNFEYLQNTNILKATGNVQLIDSKNNITINTEKIIYLKNEDKIYTSGITTVKISKNIS